MSSVPRKDITRWLKAWSSGDESALQRLTPLVYAELHQRARGLMRRERADHSLQPTALVHEAYLRLLGSAPIDWNDRSHFYALAARLMRQILVDHARSCGRKKRGGEAVRVTLDETVAGYDAPDLVRLDDALQALATVDARKSRVVELRFFGGFSVDETASILAVSPQTVLRDWRLAKVWLQREFQRRDRARS
jgi:RNA polymerase sigma-70 factor (ECF subfamily)